MDALELHKQTENQKQNVLIIHLPMKIKMNLFR